MLTADLWIKALKTADLWISGETKNLDVDELTADTRSVKSADRSHRVAFFARRGATRDGHEFLTEIAGLSQVALFVVEKVPAGWSSKTPVVVVRDTTAAMALAAKAFYGDPTGSAFTVAVTGTNGKTTSTFLLESLLTQHGKRPARTGTIETHFENLRIPSELTTPDFTLLQSLFSDLRRKGADAFVFEASSHALDQRRLLGLELDAALFTNLTPEHLDYHKTMENYYLAKRRLFFDLLAASLKKKKVAVVPEDGAYGSRLREEVSLLKNVESFSWAYGGKSDGRRVVIENWKTNLEGSEAQISGLGQAGWKVKSRLIGKYNIENMIGVVTLGLALGMDPKRIQKSLDDQAPVRGRLERVAVPTGSVFVDYAHTPDALENVLATLRPLTSGKLRVLFGCGGDRDRQKRPKMGSIAELYADEIFVTSDNPRTEDPELIIGEILNGIQRIKPTQVETDRRLAIAKSLEGLKKDDVLLIAGKGHEDYQILGTTKVPFDDREVVTRAIQTSNGGTRCCSN